MSKIITATLTSVLLFGLVFGPVGAAQGVQALGREIVVARLVTKDDCGGAMTASVTVSGTGDLSAGGKDLVVTHTYYGADSGDAEATAQAFISFAQSLGCDAGNVGPVLSMDSLQYGEWAVTCVCDRFRFPNTSSSVAGKLLKFPLGLPSEEQP
ncbi:MAG: hypothetical protein SWQ30_01800 [Thermodesulfobacteriota bacterium]|nr:hypothetical protein [Thermodesulfobacteriota bacterium]